MESEVERRGKRGRKDICKEREREEEKEIKRGRKRGKDRRR